MVCLIAVSSWQDGPGWLVRLMIVELVVVYRIKMFMVVLLTTEDGITRGEKALGRLLRRKGGFVLYVLLLGNGWCCRFVRVS